MPAQSSNVKEHKREITTIERLFTHSPFSTVTVVAHIKGNVSERMIRDAVAQVRQRHPHLRVRIVEDEEGSLWFDSEGTAEIPVEIVPRESEEHWRTVVEESCRIPFEFEVQPPIRFVLVQSPTASELIILCHHIICDGLSLAYLTRDLMEHLGNPTRTVEVLPDPVPIDRETVPEDVSVNPVVRFLIKRMNLQWAAEKVIFDQRDYECLAQAYWQHYHHRISVIELTEAQTIALVERCRQEGVTVNTVKVHSRNIYGKLGVHNRTEAAARAQALGILPST